MKRQRPVTSCLPCRQRRVGCDRTHPVCMRCASSRITCVYDESATVEASDRPPASGSQLPSTAASDLQRGSEIASFEPRNEASEQQPLPRQNSHEAGQLSVHTGGRSVYVGSTYWANPIPPEVLHPSHSGLQVTNDQLLHNDQDNDEDATYQPTPFPQWPPKQDDNNLAWAGTKFRPPRTSEFAWTRSASDKCKFCGRRYNILCVRSLLPSKEICEKLLAVFFATVFPLMPLLHARSFGDDFREFWVGVNQANIHDNEPSLLLRQKPGFLCLLSSMLFSALASASKSRVSALLGPGNVPDTGDMYFAAMVSANLTGFPRKPSIYSLAAYIFAQSQFVREEEFSDAPDFISTAFRIALGMGLHRHFPGAGFTLAEMETRRRLWWYILHLDVMSSSSSGLSPLFIDEKMANTDHISQYDCLEGDTGFTSEVDIRYIVAARRYEITKEIRLVLKCHFEDDFQSLDSVKRVAKRLNTVAEGVNSTVEALLKVRPNISTSKLAERSNPSRVGQSPTPRPFDRVWSLRPDADDQEVVDFSSWSALLLHLMVHKAYCVLYRPLFKDQLMSSHEVIRTNAIKHAQAFIQLFIRVCNDPISEPFHWMYPGTYQPLQAVSLLLADILQHAHSDDATLSRGLIDAIFELYQVDEGIVSQSEPPRRQLSPSGKDAWTMLVRTRRKALEQIGVDHHVLYPSPVISSSFCICGVRIAQENTVAPGAQQHRGDQSTAGQQEPMMDPFAVNEEQPGLSPGILGPMTIDWRAWDNALDPSIGMIQ